jgi:hypothetical protein
MRERQERIRALNDVLRPDMRLDVTAITLGVAALGTVAVARIVRTIAAFNDFCNANGPSGEHDFGAFEVKGNTIFFKIDYYDRQPSAYSPDPADPDVTRRVITIMLAEEY